jgi:hypothetical protein
LKELTKKVTNNFDTHIIFSLPHFTQKPIADHNRRNSKVMMDASLTSTSLPTSSFNTEDKTVILVHVPCLQVIPDISALGQQCLASERKITFFYNNSFDPVPLVAVAGWASQ